MVDKTASSTPWALWTWTALASLPSALLHLSALLLVVSRAAAADDMPVPASLQSAMFKKIFAYDRALQGNDALTVLVVYSDRSSGVEKITKSFAEVGISATAVQSSDLAARTGTASVIYVAPGTGIASVKEFCARNGVLSISGVPSLAEEGEVSVSIGTDAGKPRIIVNLNRAKAENHQFSSDLLKLAKVIQ